MTGEEKEMDRIRTVRFKGKRIDYFDYSQLKDDAAFVEMLHAATAFLEKQNKQTLQLINLTDAFITPGLITPILAEIERFKPYVLKQAIIGISGAKRILFKTYMTFFPGKIKAFDTEDDALEWLVLSAGLFDESGKI
jgi:hypothetical protein